MSPPSWEPAFPRTFQVQLLKHTKGMSYAALTLATMRICTRIETMKIECRQTYPNYTEDQIEYKAEAAVWYEQWPSDLNFGRYPREGYWLEKGDQSLTSTPISNQSTEHKLSKDQIASAVDETQCSESNLMNEARIIMTRTPLAETNNVSIQTRIDNHTTEFGFLRSSTETSSTIFDSSTQKKINEAQLQTHLSEKMDRNMMHTEKTNLEHPCQDMMNKLDYGTRASNLTTTPYDTTEYWINSGSENARDLSFADIMRQKQELQQIEQKKLHEYNEDGSRIHSVKPRTEVWSISFHHRASLKHCEDKLGVLLWHTFNELTGYFEVYAVPQSGGSWTDLVVLNKLEMALHFLRWWKCKTSCALKNNEFMPKIDVYLEDWLAEFHHLDRARPRPALTEFSNLGY